jgi:uncharacterized protein YceK
MCFASGCGTLMTQTHKNPDSLHAFWGDQTERSVPQPYSGTLIDLIALKEAVTLDMDFWMSGGYGPLSGLIVAVCNVVDVPLCLIADTIILPYTIPKQIDQGGVAHKCPACGGLHKKHEREQAVGVNGVPAPASRRLPEDHPSASPAGQLQ